MAGETQDTSMFGTQSCQMVIYARIKGLIKSPLKCLALKSEMSACCKYASTDQATQPSNQATKQPTNQATKQPTKQPTRNPFVPTPGGERRSGKSKISGSSGVGGAAGRAGARSVDSEGEESGNDVTSGSVGISSDLVGHVLVALIGLCIAR